MRGSLSLLLAAGVMWPAVVRAGAPTHVACVGDSITYGYAASSPSASYPSDLQRLFGSSVTVMNFGHSSATMLSSGDVPYVNQPEYTAATSFVSGAGPGASVAVVLMLGTNDSKPQNWMSGTGTRATQFQSDASAMVDHFAQLSTRPIVYVVIPPRAYSNSYGIDGTVLHDQIDQILLGVAASKGLPRIDLDTPTAGHPDLFSDGVHPTDAGYAMVAQIVHDGLVSATGGGLGGAGGGAGSAGTNGGSGVGGIGGRVGVSGGTNGSGGSGGTIAVGSGGTIAGGSGGGSGGSGSGGAKSGGTGSGGSGTSGTGTGGSASVASTGGNDGSGGHSPASGGAAPSSSGGSGGATTSAASGGSGAASDSGGGGCACSLGGPPLDDWCLAGLAVSLLGLRVARRRRAGGRR